jgi:UDP-glucose 4-epimerase
MDMIHVGDVARANILAAQSEASDIVLNVASQAETSLLDLAHALATTMGRAGLAPVHQPARAVNPVPRRLGSAKLAAKMIGFRASIPLEDGIRDLVRWWQDEQMAPFDQETIR